MQVGRIANVPVAASMRIGNTALQAQQKKNDNDLAGVIPQMAKTDAQNSTKDSMIDSKKISNDTQAKLEVIKEEMRMELTPEDIKEARRLLHQMQRSVKGFADSIQKSADELRLVTDEKTKIDDILSGKTKANFEDMPNNVASFIAYGSGSEKFLDGTLNEENMHTAIAGYKTRGSYENLIEADLNDKEKAAAYKLYGDKYLKDRSEALQKRDDHIREFIDGTVKLSKFGFELIQFEWDNKFGSDPKLKGIMEKMMLGSKMDVNPNSKTLLADLERVITATNKHLEDMNELVDEFETLYGSKIKGKVYA